MIHNLRHKVPFPSTNSSSVITSLRDNNIYYFPTICEGLQKVSDLCYAVKLQECYVDRDVAFHMAYLLEDLKLNGAELSSHIITGIKVVSDKVSSNNSTNSSLINPTSANELYTIDISDCPVFDGSLEIELPKR